MSRLDLVRFDNGKFGLQEIDDEGFLTVLWDESATQIHHGARQWAHVRTLASGADYAPDDPDDFWRALDGVGEITPEEP